MADVTAPVTLAICTTCRRVAGELPEIEADNAPDSGPDNAPDNATGTPRPGARLLAELTALGLPDGVRLRPVECLSACSRGCAIALSGGPARWSYVYGNIDPARDARAILEGAARYAATEDGIVPWRARPELFRKNSIARLPPHPD